jgi:methylenetetrahydrofolate reductase (NADPH)
MNDGAGEGRVDPPVSVAIELARLAREASIEIGIHDLKQLAESHAYRAPASRVYLSFLHEQAWEETERAARAIRGAGFEPVPHIPVRRIPSARALERLLYNLVRGAQVREVLLIAGDYDLANGPYSCAADVLRAGVLEDVGLTRVSVGGHPEGHPVVPLQKIREAEREKATIAAEHGLEATFVTQFFFEAAPFLRWVDDLRTHQVRSRIVAGLAGPATIATLFRFGLRCGVGPSIRALGSRARSVTALAADHGPQQVMRTLAAAHAGGQSDFDAFHFYTFGGYLRTCRWLEHIANGRFTLDERGSFEVARA